IRRIAVSYRRLVLRYCPESEILPESCRLQTVSKTGADSSALRRTAENRSNRSNCRSITRLDQKSRAISKLENAVNLGSNPAPATTFLRTSNEIPTRTAQSGCAQPGNRLVSVDRTTRGGARVFTSHPVVEADGVLVNADSEDAADVLPRQR